MADEWDDLSQTLAIMNGGPWGRSVPENAAFIAVAFVVDLMSGAKTASLDNYVTPESASNWGDFSSAVELFKTMPNRGLVAQAQHPLGVPDVAFVGIVADCGVPLQAHEALGSVEPNAGLPIAAELTLIWRPEFHRWLVHSISSERPAIEELPRSSAGAGPDAAHA